MTKEKNKKQVKQLKKIDLSTWYFIMGFIGFSMVIAGMMVYTKSVFINLIQDTYSIQILDKIVSIIITIFSMWCASKIMFRYFIIKKENYKWLVLYYLVFNIGLQSLLIFEKKLELETIITATITGIISQIYFMYLIYKDNKEWKK